MTTVGKIILIALLVLNLFTFLLYAVDKAKAKKNKWRIPEATLILFAFIGGSIGALFGMFALRHKTQHIKFKLLVPLAFILHIAIFVLICVYF